MYFVVHQMLCGKGKLEGGDFWIRVGILEKSSLVLIRGFALRERRMPCVVRQMLCGKGKLEGGDFWIGDKYSKK